MAVKEFGSTPKTSSDFVNEIYKAIGEKFPIELEVVQGKLAYFKYQTTWKEGYTTPEQKTRMVKDPATGKKVQEAFTHYAENYTDKKLTQAQIKKIDAWVEKQIGG